MSKRILLTGGAGFIGSHIADFLSDRGDDVLVYDNLSTGLAKNVPDGAELVIGDLQDRIKIRQVVKGFEPDVICHQAAQASVSLSLSDPYADFEPNMIGSFFLLDAAREFGCKSVVFASSGGAIMGECDIENPKDEHGAQQLVNPYAASKLSTENFLESYKNAYGIKSWSLRYSNVYGPRQNPLGEAGVVSAFCTGALSQTPLNIYASESKGDRGCVRDYVYVSDVVRANVLAIDNALPCEIYNVSTGVATDTQTLAQLVVDAAIKNSEIAITPEIALCPPRGGDVKISVLNAERIVSAGWKPTTELRDGIAATLESFRKAQ